MKYDFCIVGSGFYGSICAYELSKEGYNVCVLEKRNHIGGNCYTNKKNDIHIHEYGPHVFHTSDEEVWKWINQFVNFNNFKLSPVANYKGEIYSLPFNMWTFSKILGVSHPDQAERIIKEQSKHIKDPSNFEEQAIKLVGTDVYEKLIKGYTMKQWKKHPLELPSSIIKRLPVRFTYDNNYFNDKYQGIPIGGYTKIFEKLLEGIEVLNNVDYLNEKQYWDEKSKYIIYTGPIDKFYNYEFGQLEYKTTQFEHKLIIDKNYQGTAMMNYTDYEIPFTRCIEHKFFENLNSDVTWVTWEYPIEYQADKTEPMYPVNDNENNHKYTQYKMLSNLEKNIIFGGRLAEYKYYDMHQVIRSALNKVTEIKKNIKI